MIQITDEILNKYLDGELSVEEVKQIKSALHNSDELQRKYNALKLVHDSLSSFKEDEVSPGFTEKLMKQLVTRIYGSKTAKIFHRFRCNIYINTLSCNIWVLNISNNFGNIFVDR